MPGSCTVHCYCTVVACGNASQREHSSYDQMQPVNRRTIRFHMLDGNQGLRYNGNKLVVLIGILSIVGLAAGSSHCR